MCLYVRRQPSLRQFQASTGGFKPVDTLAGKSAFIHQRTSERRLPSFNPVVPKAPNRLSKTEFRDNDHTAPYKKRKTVDVRASGQSAASAINLDDSQPRDESEDELALNSEAQSRAFMSDGQHVHKSHDLGQPSIASGRKSNDISPVRQREPVRRASSLDESGFTKGSAQQRKAEKDRILDSPPDPRELLITAQISPYFGLTAPIPKSEVSVPEKSGRLEPVPESPDALQGGETRPRRELKEKPYQMRTKALGALIVGSPSGTTITRSFQPRVKNAINPEELFELEELFYPPLVATSTYSIRVNTSTKEFSFYTTDSILPNEDPLMDPRPLRQIAVVQYAADTPSLVSLDFSRKSGGQDKMFLRFTTAKAAIDFLQLIGNTEHGLRMHGKEA